MANIIKRSGNWFIDQLNVYQASNSDIASIKNNFLVRMDEFRMIIDAMKSKAGNDPLQHELILGRRGSGKSTLLKRIEIEIQEDKELSKKFIPINLAEEQAGIYRLFDLWEQVLSELSFKFKIALQLKDFKSFDSENNYARYVFEEIHKLCSDLHVKVVLLLDNFDRIAENMDDNGNLLRELLINYNDVQIIAGSTRMDEYFWAYDKPFYEFFRRHKLEALSREEIRLLLNHWADTLELPELKTFVENNPGKLENIRLLTDGLPRTLQFFIQMVLQKEGADSYEYLKKIMDTVSPLYQERLNHLPPPQRKLVLEIAFFWEACSTKQLAEKAKMESKLVSAQLKQLEQKGIVDKIETDSKNHLYRLSERFFNLWLIITQGSPEQKRKAKWLSIFLENFYDENTLRQLCSHHLSELRNNKISWKKALIFSKALSQSRYVNTRDRDELITLTEKLAGENIQNSLLALPKRFNEILLEIKKDVETGAFDLAVSKANEIENEQDGGKEFILGNIYIFKSEYDKAVSYYQTAISKGWDMALIHIGIAYIQKLEVDKAEKYWLEAVERGNTQIYFGLGKLYEDSERFELAKKYYLLAYKEKQNASTAKLGMIYYNEGKFELAEMYLLEAKQLGDIEAAEFLGALYITKGKYYEAEETLLNCKSNGSENANLFLGELYAIQEKYELAESVLLEAKKDNLAEAYYLLGKVYLSKNQIDLAEEHHLIASERGIKLSDLDLGTIYWIKNENNKAKAYLEKAIKIDEPKGMANSILGAIYAEECSFDMAQKHAEIGLEKGSDYANAILPIIYFNKNIRRDIALHLYTEAKDKDNLQMIIIEIWNGIFNNIEWRVREELKRREFQEVGDFWENMLIHQQKNLVLNLFNNPEFGKTLQEKYMVIYYATLLLTKQGDKNLELKIPPELNEPIQDLLKHIHEKEIFYGYKRD